jgi:sodium-dependent dicarboxylate transporter 2/3/5
MLAAFLLFVIPINLKKGEFVLDWEWAKKIPWDVLILFGGGLALAQGFRVSGLSKLIANQVGFFKDIHPIFLIAIVTIIVALLTELTSNTATATIFLPILGAIAIGIDQHPFLLMIPAAIAASLAFMLPVATPPNAVVFGSGYVSGNHMAKTGIWMNILGIILTVTFTYLIALKVFGIELNALPEFIKP